MRNAFSSSAFGSSASDATKLPLTGGTLTGALTVNVASGNLIVGQLSGSEKFKVTSDGILSLGNNFNAQTYGVADSWTLGLQGNATCAFYGSSTAANRQIRMSGGGYFGWSAGSPDGALDLILNRNAAATLQLGVNHATTATNQTIKAHNVTTGTGADLILCGGTGSVANGNVRFGVRSAIGAETITGFITIKDESGTVRKLAVVS